jgi:hypothetical protein
LHDTASTVQRVTPERDLPARPIRTETDLPFPSRFLSVPDFL